jgi:hypothetical protein
MGGDQTIPHRKLKPSEALPYAHGHNEKMMSISS